VLGVFALSAMCLRPIAGWQMDRRGRVPVLALGAAIFAVASLGYVLVQSIAALLLLRVFHGAGMGLGATAGPVLAGDLAPAGRRGEAIGLQGAAQNLASAVGPAAGAAAAVALGYVPLFLAAGALAAVAAVAALLIAEPSRRGEPASASPARPSDASAAPARPRNRLARFYAPGAVRPALLALGLHAAYGAVISFVPLYALRAGLENPGLYFLVFALAMIGGQTAGGWASDRVGRSAVIVPGLLLLAVGVAMLPALSGWAILASALVVGLGQGSAQPTIFALAVDRVEPADRGVALGTVGTLLELGIGAGSIAAGVIAEAAGLEAMFVALAAAPLAAAVLALARRSVDAH
jgi:MFS family permease